MNNPQKATFAAGCFWGVEHKFGQIPGVLATRVGYTGGKTDSPTYKDVCYKDTGHAEAVEVTFDPVQVTFGQLLDTFWKMHDPRQVDRQGPDVGDQYRSAIFFHSSEQEAEALASKEQVQPRFSRPIATKIIPAVTFYDAEDYHQKYLEKRGLPSCHI